MLFKNNNSLQQSAAEMNSASVLDNATIGCLRDAQLIGPPQNSIIYPDVLFLVSTSPA